MQALNLALQRKENIKIPNYCMDSIISNLLTGVLYVDIITMDDMPRRTLVSRCRYIIYVTRSHTRGKWTDTA